MKRHLAGAALIGLMVGATPALAQQPSIEELVRRIDALQRRVNELEAERTRPAAPVAGSTATNGVAASCTRSGGRYVSATAAALSPPSNGSAAPAGPLPGPYALYGTPFPSASTLPLATAADTFGA